MVAGEDLKATLVANCLWGTWPLSDLWALYLVRANPSDAFQAILLANFFQVRFIIQLLASCCARARALNNGQIMRNHWFWACHLLKSSKAFSFHFIEFVDFDLWGPLKTKTFCPHRLKNLPEAKPPHKQLATKAVCQSAPAIRGVKKPKRYHTLSDFIKKGLCVCLLSKGEVSWSRRIKKNPKFKIFAKLPLNRQDTAKYLNFVDSNQLWLILIPAIA